MTVIDQCTVQWAAPGPARAAAPAARRPHWPTGTVTVRLVTRPAAAAGLGTAETRPAAALRKKSAKTTSEAAPRPIAGGSESFAPGPTLAAAPAHPPCSCPEEGGRPTPQGRGKAAAAACNIDRHGDGPGGGRGSSQEPDVSPRPRRTARRPDRPPTPRRKRTKKPQEEAAAVVAAAVAAAGVPARVTSLVPVQCLTQLQ